MTECPPGSHPHDDRPNWQPAVTIDEYVSNVREGLEVYSRRRMAKLLGVPPIELYRWQQMAAIPMELFERLLADHRDGSKLSTKRLAQIGQALKGGAKIADVEYCPHCHKATRFRRRWSEAQAQIVNDWIDEQADS